MTTTSIITVDTIFIMDHNPMSRIPIITASSQPLQLSPFVPFGSLENFNVHIGGTNASSLYHPALQHRQPFFGQPLDFVQQLPTAAPYEEDEDIEMKDVDHSCFNATSHSGLTKALNEHPSLAGEIITTCPPFKLSSHHVMVDQTNNKIASLPQDFEPEENGDRKCDSIHPILEASTFGISTPSMVGQLRPANFENSSDEDEDEEEEWKRIQIKLGRIFESDLAATSTNNALPVVAPKAAKVVWNSELDREIISLPMRRHSRLPDNFIPVKSSVPSYPFTHPTARFIDSPPPVHPVLPESYEEHQYVYTPQDEQSSHEMPTRQSDSQATGPSITSLSQRTHLSKYPGGRRHSSKNFRR
ncbi:hypothetical protein CPB86DRAFT_532166 [Serendipita vermifera]|nr:hypothetical protein CPB86DRAFT_532166 [Serendipita vermifera]